MMLDQVLKILIQQIKTVDYKIPAKDRRILISLASQLDQGHFLTENQANLLVKILKENEKTIVVEGVDLTEDLKLVEWSQPFRVIEHIRKIYLNSAHPDLIFVEFTHDKRLKNKLLSLNGKLSGSVTSISPKVNAVLFCEKNIRLVVKEFANDNFVIDEKIVNFDQEIRKILKTNNNPFNIFQLENTAVKKLIKDEVGPITYDNLLLLHDRKLRYQYEISEKITEKSLTADIAQRQSTRIFIDSNAVSLVALLKSIKELHRFPLLIIFDGHNSKTDKKTLNLLAEAITANDLDDKVGIYFRFTQSSDLSNFNATVGELKYNKKLDSTTTIVGIANNKIPKFLVNLNWKPNSIISFTANFKNNKSYVYFSDVDLSIYYADRQPLSGGIDAVQISH
jgi:hypothetical protein